MAKVLIVGHSLSLALLDAYGEYVETCAQRRRWTDAEYAFAVSWRDEVTEARLTSRGFVRRQHARPVEAFVEENDATHIAISWWGNQMNAKALLLDGPPFDFVTPSDRDYHDDPLVQLIPYSVIRSVATYGVRADTNFSDMLERLRDRSARVCLLGPPPPMPEQGVRERLEGEQYFVEMLARLGRRPSDVALVPDRVRRRLWNVLLDAYRSLACDYGADFVAPPSEASDAAGMLLPQFWGHDVTHSNAAYGALYLDKVNGWVKEAPGG